MRLGRLAHDPVALARAPSLATHRLAAAAPRPMVDRSDVDFVPGLYSNDTLPDCTVAALANAAGMVAALNGYTLAIDATRIPPFYAACVGCEATDAAMMATDGVRMLDVLTRQWSVGLDIGQQVPLFGKFASLPLTRLALAQSIDRLGHALPGVVLRERDMELRPVWDFADGRDDGAVVGGHQLVAWDYAGLADDDTVRVATWGTWQPATWAWVEARISGEEAYATVWRELARADGLDIGVDVEMLDADLASFAGA